MFENIVSINLNVKKYKDNVIVKDSVKIKSDLE